MSYTIDVACSETSGSGWSINYDGMPSCAGTDCTVGDFDTMVKKHMEAEFAKTITAAVGGGTWSCTATATVPTGEAVLSVE